MGRGGGTLYVVANRLGGGGVGDIAFEAVLGFHRAGLVEEVAAPALDRPVPGLRFRPVRFVPRRLVPFVSLETYHAWRAHWLERAFAGRVHSGLQVFHGWAGTSRAAFRRARGLGVRTVLSCASTHAVHQDRVLAEEHARFGVSYRRDAAYIERSLEEYEAADAIVVPSPQVIETFRARNGSAARCVLVPFGVDLERFRPARPEERPRDGTFTVLFVGQVSLRKGIPDLLAAWARIRGSGLRLVVAGPVRYDAERFVEAARGQDDIRWTGLVRETEGLYHAADVCVFPSVEEGSALVSLEALAAGVPQVVTPQVGSLIEDGVEGIVVPARDPARLAEAILRLRDDRAARARMAVAARALAGRHPWSRYGDALAGLHRGLADGTEA